MRKTLWLIAPLCAGLFLSARPAAAQEIARFDVEEAFTAAVVSPLQTRDFEELEDGAAAPEFPYGDVRFRSTEGGEQALMVVSPSESFPSVRSKTLFSNQNFNPVVVEFATPVTAWSGQIVSLPKAAPAHVFVETSAGNFNFVVTLKAEGPTFIGFVAKGCTISRVSVGNPADRLPDDQEFIGLDDVKYGDAEVAPPAETPVSLLDQLSASIADGRANGEIVRVSGVLELKVCLARKALELGYSKIAYRSLSSLAHQVRAHRGTRIAPARADHILGLVQECQDLIAGS